MTHASADAEYAAIWARMRAESDARAAGALSPSREIEDVKRQHCELCDAGQYDSIKARALRRMLKEVT